MHFLRNALHYLPRKQADDCPVEVRWGYDRHDADAARRDLAAVETHEEWVDENRCLDMDLLRKHRKRPSQPQAA